MGTELRLLVWLSAIITTIPSFQFENYYVHILIVLE